MEVHEKFMGLYLVLSIDADTLVTVIKDCLLRMNLSLTKCRGQCYDGASNICQELIRELSSSYQILKEEQFTPTVVDIL